MFNNAGHLIRLTLWSWVAIDMARMSERALRDAGRAHKALKDQNEEALELRPPENHKYDRRVGIFGGFSFAVLAATSGWLAYESGKALVT